MASELGVQTIQHTNGTDAMTIDSSGYVSMPNTTEIDIWHLTANQSIAGSSTVLITGWSRWATDWEKIGTGMTESSGIFTFPSTGKWRVYTKLYLISGATAYYHGILGEVSTDSGANFTYRSLSYQGATANEYVDSSNFLFVDVTNTSTVKVRFQYQVHSSATLGGSAASLRTHLVFEKLSAT